MASENQIEESSRPGREVRKEGQAGQKAAARPAVERANEKTEVIAMMNSAKGATLAEIVEATGRQKHTVRGFVSILGSKGGGLTIVNTSWSTRKH